jgi:hypothetical protein
VSLQLVRTNTPTGGLAEGSCDLAVVRTPSEADRVDPGRFGSAVVGLDPAASDVVGLLAQLYRAPRRRPGVVEAGPGR